MTPINSRTSGKRGELMVAELLRQNGIPARRGQQFSGGSNSPDIVHALGKVIHIEVKWQNRLLLDDWYDQAMADGGYRIPVIIHRRKGRGSKAPPWSATTSLRDLAMLMGNRQPEMFEDGSADRIRDLTSRVLRVDFSCVKTDALRFDAYFAAAVAERHATDRPVGLAHARKPEGSLWMVSIMAEDFLKIAQEWAWNEFGYPPSSAPASPLTGDLEIAMERFWRDREHRVAEVLPIYRSEG